MSKGKSERKIYFIDKENFKSLVEKEVLFPFKGKRLTKQSFDRNIDVALELIDGEA